MISSRLAIEARRLQGDADLFERGVRGVELAQAAIDQDQRGEGLLVVEQALVAALNHLAHAGEVVDAGNSLHLELAVVGLLHRAVFPDDHGGHRLGALDVRDVEALDAAGSSSSVSTSCSASWIALIAGCSTRKR